MSRLENTARNFVWATINNIVISAISFVSRTVFIYYLGTYYLGINSLFTNVLSMLSLAELGISAAINFSLYKPLAENDHEKIKALMHFYKRSYRWVAMVISCLGLFLLPFLHLMIKDASNIDELYWIYLIFLFNSVYSYLFSYKRTLLSADQKAYLLTNIMMLVSLITLSLQIVAILAFHRYYAYLFVGAMIGIIQNIYVNAYINKKYPYLIEKEYVKLSQADKKPMMKNIKAMMFHKLGDLCVNQTSNIIISAFINITMVGIISNYQLLIEGINRFVISLFNSASASFGNLIVKENDKKVLAVFESYNFLAFWLFSWTAICLYYLLNPMITLWLGQANTVSEDVLLLIVFNYYLAGMRVPIGIVKAAGGLYVQDQFIPIVQSVINLIVSIICVQYWGLIGVYVGAIASSIVPCWYRPIIVYRHIFHTKPQKYVRQYISYALVLVFNLYFMFLCLQFFSKKTMNYMIFSYQFILCCIIPHLWIILLFHRTNEFKYILKILMNLRRKRLGS